MTATSPPSSLSRRPELDGLRGLAVILMLGQHLMVWLWDHDPSSPFADLLLACSAAGGLAAPLFVTLAGCSGALAASRPNAAPKRSIARGLALLAMAYLLNLVTPSWFSLRSFYILHLLGIGLLIGPWCARQSRSTLIILTMIIAGLTALGQAQSALPLSIGNDFMSARPLAPGLGQAMLDHGYRALLAGHFPLLPWLLPYLLGVIAGQGLRTRQRLAWPNAIGPLLIGITGLGLALSGVVQASPTSWGFRLVAATVPFFPCSAALCLSLCGVALSLICITSRAPRLVHGLVNTGRISLTVLVIHLPLFRELSRPVGAWRNLEGGSALALIFGSMLATVILSNRWARADYRYGAEWLLRRVDKLFS